LRLGGIEGVPVVHCKLLAWGLRNDGAYPRLPRALEMTLTAEYVGFGGKECGIRGTSFDLDFANLGGRYAIVCL